MPTRRRRVVVDDEDFEKEDDEPTTSRRRRRRPAEDDETEERPRSRRRPSEDDEDEKPRSRRSRRVGEDYEPDEDDDEDDVSLDDVVATGWGGAKRTIAENSSFPDGLKLTEEEVVVYFPQDGPFVSHAQHWIEGRKSGKKGFICLKPENGCPMCKHLSDKPRAKTFFNVIVLEPGAKPAVQVLEAGPKLTNKLAALNEGKNGPLHEAYWSMGQTGQAGKKGSQIDYQVQHIKERDLKDDWDVKPLTDDDLDALEKRLYKPDFVRLPTRAELMEVVAEITGD